MVNFLNDFSHVKLIQMGSSEGSPSKLVKVLADEKLPVFPFDVIVHFIKILLREAKCDRTTLLNFLLTRKLHYNAFLKIANSVAFIAIKFGFYTVTFVSFN